MSDKKTCLDCRFAVEEDYGYSNYTVEGTDVHCLKKLNSDLPKDRWYGEESALFFAEECPSYEEGRHISICVEEPRQEAIEGIQDSVVVELFKAYFGME